MTPPVTTPERSTGRIAAAWRWAHKNLFRSFGDALVTLVVGAISAYVLYRFLRFVFVTGRWDIVRVNLSLFMKGTWPSDQLWRLSVTVIGVATLGGLVAGHMARRQREMDPGPPPPPAERVRGLIARLWPGLLALLLLLLLTATAGPWLLTLAAAAGFLAARLIGGLVPTRSATPVVLVVMVGGIALVWLLTAGVPLDGWGGLMLNLSLAAVAISLCFPVGVVMALGRRSDYPIVRLLCTAYIELFRGTPLIALLLMANVAIGFFIPSSLDPGPVLKAIVVLVLFTGAYVAEIVRGGLQSVPTGQIEAGRALGLSTLAVTRRIVLPQALRNVIPALVGQFISLFKDTTLVGAAMVVTDLLAAAEASTAQTGFRGQGLIVESLVFVLLIFWAGSYTMSNESQRFESRLGVGR
ncbi:MAG: amino acid ABC transporter permease [Acidimicrobiales bacterium]